MQAILSVLSSSTHAHTHMHDLRRVINEGHSAPCEVKATFDLGNGDVNRKLTSMRALMCRVTWRLRAYWQFWSGFLTLAFISQSTRIYRCAVCEGNPSGKRWRSLERWMRETKKITCTCFMFAPKPLKYLNLILFLHARFVFYICLRVLQIFFWVHGHSHIRGMIADQLVFGAPLSFTWLKQQQWIWGGKPSVNKNSREERSLVISIFLSIVWSCQQLDGGRQVFYTGASSLHDITPPHRWERKKMSPQFFHCQEVAPININHRCMAWCSQMFLFVFTF